VFGEISSTAQIMIEKIVRQVIKEIGYDDDVKGLNFLTCDVLVNIKNVKVFQEKTEQIHIGSGYATNETDEYVSFHHMLANNLTKRFTDERKTNKSMTFLHQYSKFIVSVEYKKADKAEAPVPIMVRAIYTHVLYDNDTKLDDVKRLIFENVITPVIPSKYLDKSSNISVVRFNKLKLSELISGTSGKHLYIDTGGCSPFYGLVHIGKEYLNMSRVATFAARWISKSLIANGLCKRVLVQLTYFDQTINIRIDSFNTSFLSEKELIDVVTKNFNLSLDNLVKTLQLKKAFNKTLTTKGYFMNQKDFVWEVPIKFN